MTEYDSIDPTTLAIRFMRMRSWVDEEIEHLNTWELKEDYVRGYCEGKIVALSILKAQYLLTNDESSEREQTAREMGLR